MNKFFVALFLFTASSVWAQNKLSNALGNYTSDQRTPEGLTITTDNGKARILIYDAATIRITLSKNATFDDFTYAVVAKPVSGLYKIQEGNTMVLTTDSIKLEITKNPVRFTLYNAKGQLLNQDEPAFGTSWIGEEVTTYKKLQPDEKFIGLGEKTGNLNRRGEGYTNWNTDNFAYATNADPIYASIPFYMGIHNNIVYGVFMDNSYKSHFNFGASNNRFMSFTAEDGDMDYYLIGRSTVQGILESYTSLTGRMEMPAKWALGYQQCRYSYYPDKEVLSVAKTFREKNIPADVIYLDIHYMDQYKIFTWNKERFPDPAGMLKELKNMGFHLVVIVDPGIKTENGYQAYEDGLKKDMFLKYPDGTNYTGQVWPGWCHFPDFTKPATRQWWGQSFKGYVNDGVDGFWNDMNEPATWGQRFPDLVEFDFDGHKGTHRRGHNLYGMQMSRSTFEGTKSLMNGRRPFILTRASYAGGQRYSAIWTGDNQPNDDHMICGVRLVNSLGLSGFPFAGMDVGGFAGDASRDLYARWIQIGAFSPFFRGHTMVDSKDKEPWSHGEKDEEISRNFIQLRYNLMPYIYSTFWEATQNGMPVSRSLAFYHTYDSKIYDWNYQNQYYFGAGLMVAPYVSYRDLNRLYLPEGDWYDFYTGKKEAGRQEKIEETPVERLTLYAKGGAIIPMQSPVQSAAQRPSDTLFLHIWKGNGQFSFVYYEDEGDGYGYQNGNYYKRTILYNEGKKEITLGTPEGKYTSHFKFVKYIFHGFDFKSALNVDGKKYTAERGQVAFIQALSTFDPIGSPGYQPKNEVQWITTGWTGNSMTLKW